jgi:hypothetical protein
MFSGEFKQGSRMAHPFAHLDDDFPAEKPWLFEIESLSMENQ